MGKLYLPVLHSEFAAEEGSFLLQLRCDFRWDKQAFLRLTAAMEQYCADIENVEQVDRYMAESFWYLSFFVKDHAMHKASVFRAIL
jgi:hypothetical protein